MSQKGRKKNTKADDKVRVNQITFHRVTIDEVQLLLSNAAVDYKASNTIT